jgi:hypothetical protein
MKKIWIMVLLAPVLFACSSVTPQIVKFDDANAKATVENATQIMKHWPMNSGAIREGLGAAITEKLPVKFGKSLDRLDTYSLQYPEGKVVAEKDAGRIVVLVGNLIEPIVQTIINQYAPGVWTGVLKYLPSFITL